MRNFWLILCVLWLWTCSGGEKASGPQEPPIVINLTSLGGQAQKGPFNNGTAINVAELTNTLSPTGRNFSSAITDNTGRFAVANVQLESPYVELRANGYYFNEVSNEISSGQLTLFALSNLTGKTSLNVNILTHLEKNRMVTLMSGDNPKTFAQAKIQAQDEVFAIFDYSRANVPESELLDISQSGAANAKLLAISAIVQGDLAVGQMSQLLANISTDIAADGTLDDTNLRNTLIENSKNLNMAEVRSNLVAHYVSLGISATIPDFESEVNQFLKPPVVQDIDLSVDEDNAINITLTGFDPEGESITFSIVDDTDNATLTLNGNVVNYAPNAHFNGTDIFTYKANDGTSDSNTGTVTISVNAVDDEPNTIDVTATTDEDNTVDVSLSAEEYDGDNYSFAIITDVSNGTTSLNGSTVTYTPNQDFNGEDSFTFEATDDTGRTINVATATITVNAVNDAPVANDITNQVTDENRMMQLDITLDATDVDGDALTYNITSTNNGSATINDNIATYVPNQDWNGEDTFTYVANDGALDSNAATVTITVNAVDDPPTTPSKATGQIITLNEDTPTQFNITYEDVDGDAAEFEYYQGAIAGTITIDSVNDNGVTVTYSPTENWNGADSSYEYRFKTVGTEIYSNIGAIFVDVLAVDDAPVVVDSTFVIDEDQVIDITLTASDVDDEDLFTWAGQSGPSNGTVVILDANSSATASKTYRYTPNTNYNGNDSFTYYATNQNAQISNTATISFTINPVNDGPIANNLDMTVDEDSSGSTIAIKGDDNGATDPESDAITYSIVTLPSHGSIYNDAGGGQPDGDALAAGDELTSFFTIYNPNANYNGTDTFTFKGNDGSLDGNIATVTITVNPTNDPPTAEDISVVTRENVAIDFSGNGTDIDPGATLTYTITSQPTNGTITSGNNINFVYQPNVGYLGTDSASYVANDGETNSNNANINITVIAGSAPIANNSSFDLNTSNIDGYEINLTEHSNDPDFDPLTYSLVTGPDIGTASLNESMLTYYPDQDELGNIYQTSLTWMVNDGANDSNIATIDLNVNLEPAGFIVSVNEYDGDAYNSNFSSGLRTEQVSYLGDSNSGSTGFIVENRAGGINQHQYLRDFDRFGFWKDDYSIEINFNETSLAWDYLRETVNGYVPYAIYMIDNLTEERIQIFAAFWDYGGELQWNCGNADCTAWSGPVSGGVALEPIYAFAPANLNSPYDPQKDAQYLVEDDLTTSGGIGWSSSAAEWELPDGGTVNYPFVTATLITNKSAPSVSLAAPTLANQNALNTGYTSGSAIYFKTESLSSKNLLNQPIQIPLRPGFNYIEK